MNMQKCKCIEESFNHPQREEQLQQRQGASGATSLPTSQAGRASLSMNSQVPASFVQEPNNPSQVHKLWCTEQEQCAVLAAGRVLLQWQTWRSSQLLHSRLQCHYLLPPCHNSGWCSQPECLASDHQWHEDATSSCISTKSSNSSHDPVAVFHPSSCIMGPLLSSLACEPHLASLMQEIFLVAQTLTTINNNNM